MNIETLISEIDAMPLDEKVDAINFIREKLHDISPFKNEPIVSMPDPDGKYEVIDGFHRHRVGKEMPAIQERIKGYLPLVQIRETQTDKSDRMASTIRHNRARGKHKVEAMSDIVIELKKRNWSDEKIAKNLGMEPDEVLRLCQISGLVELQK